MGKRNLRYVRRVYKTEGKIPNRIGLYWSPNEIALIERPTEAEQMIAVKASVSVINRIHYPTIKVQKYVVSEVGYLIQHIHNPNWQVQLLAVKNQPHAIRYIKKPSKRVLDYLYNNHSAVFAIYYKKLVVRLKKMHK